MGKVKEENIKKIMEAYEAYLYAAERYEKTCSLYCDATKAEAIRRVKEKRKNSEKN